MTDKATPTITLAQLYENQNQFLDALVIYQKLMKTKPSEELQSKINELKDKIFTDNTLEYSHTVDKIFTNEDKKKFKILPHEQYENFKESQTQHKGEETYPEEMIKQKAPEKEEPEIAEPEVTETPEIHSEETVDEVKEPEPEIEPDEFQIEEKIEEEIPEVEPETESDEIEAVQESDELQPESTEIEEQPEEPPDSNVNLEPPEQFDEESKEPEEFEQKEEETPKPESEKISEPWENIEPELTEPEIKEKEPIEEIPEPEEVKDIEEDLKSPVDSTVLEVLNQIKELDPKALNEVLIENLGKDKTLDEVKLSDIHYAIELLKSDPKAEDK